MTEPLTLVIDDDPTGIQTVHGVWTYMHWSREVMRHLFGHDRLAFIQTNTRALPESEAIRINREIMTLATETARETGRAFSVVSRSDSTLRGHYPAEPEAIAQTLEQAGWRVDAEILCFFLAEAGRVTVDNTHYIQQVDGSLVPVSETEFARDPVFGYQHADLTRYIQEKTGGRVQADTVRSLPVEWLESDPIERCVNVLLGLHNGAKLVVNALTQHHVDRAVRAISQAEGQGKRFVFRSAASFVKAYGHITDHPLLTSRDLVPHLAAGPVLTVVGSYTSHTTHQLHELLREPAAAPIELNVSTLLSDFGTSVQKAVEQCQAAVRENREPVLFTSRQGLAPAETGVSLSQSGQISRALAAVVHQFPWQPRAIIAKGGITSSDVATQGLGMEKAFVLGQIRPSIPLVLAGPESRYPHLPYVIFPGNTGQEADLRSCWNQLRSR